MSFNEDINSWTRELFDDTRCYCEENIWKLCEKLKSAGHPSLDSSYAVFISNEERKIPFWNQRAGKREADHMVVWDYHVVLVVKKSDGSFVVVDFDSVQEFVTPFFQYILLSVRDESQMVDRYKRKFRVVPATVYLEKFASDRSHMLREDGSYMSPPPSYPPIKCEESSNNIQDFISMDPSRGYGTVHNLESFVDFFSYKR